MRGEEGKETEIGFSGVVVCVVKGVAGEKKLDGGEGSNPQDVVGKGRSLFLGR